MTELAMRRTLQCVYLGISLVSSGCCLFQVHVVPCSNFVGLTCLLDFLVLKRKDMMMHHLFVIGMLHFMNTHEIDDQQNVVTTLLSPEISTIFLILNNFMQPGLVKRANQLAFVSTFAYYRLYNYTKAFHMTFFERARDPLETWQIYISIYGLFALNVYWGMLIALKALDPVRKQSA